MIKAFCDGCGKELRLDESGNQGNRGGQQAVEWTIGDQDFKVNYAVEKKSQTGYKPCRELCWTCLETILNAGDYVCLKQKAHTGR